MNNSEIKQNMSKGLWEISALDGVNILSSEIEDNYIVTCDSDNEPLNTDLANSQAICLAVNNTWNIGIDPSAVKAMYDMLGRLCDNNGLNEAYENEIKSLLKSATL